MKDKKPEKIIGKKPKDRAQGGIKARTEAQAKKPGPYINLCQDADLSVEGEVRILEKLREKQLHDQVSDLNYARQEGRREGRREGRQEGRQEGRREGRREGRQEIILNMFKEKFDVSAVSKVTGLSEAEILAERERAKKLRKNGKID